MKQPTPSEYLQYAQQMNKLRAQQEMEKLRLVYAQHQYVLEQVPHLKPAFEALLVLDETRDYAALAQQIDQNLVALEAWLLNTWQPALRQYPELRTDWAELVQHIELYQFRRVPSLFVNMQQQIVETRQQRVDAEARAKREAEEKARRDAEARAKREAEEKARRDAEARTKREAEEKAQREAAARAKREAEEKALHDSYWSGFQKIGRDGVVLHWTAPQWAAVKHIATGLIWATNWAEGDDFPVTGGFPWYQSGVRLVEKKSFFSTKIVEEPYAIGFCNGGKNTESHIQKVNQQRWCSQQDWYLPNIEELESLANALHLNGAYSLERFQALFPHDAVDVYWSATPMNECGIDLGVFIYFGNTDYELNNLYLHVRAVRKG